jgi:hypothetical protein
LLQRHHHRRHPQKPNSLNFSNSSDNSSQEWILCL